jgi:hypothetical protein
MHHPKVPIKKTSRKSDEHAKVRRTSTWKKFRLSQLDKKDYTCELSLLKRKKGLQLHHTDPDNYEDLDPNKFIVLTKSEHANLERLLSIKDFDIDAYCERLKDAYKRSKSE